MQKAQTILIGTDGKKKIGEGDSVFCVQATKVNNDRGIDSNMDWSFNESWGEPELIGTLALFLETIEDVFGEKIVSRAIQHYALDTKKDVQLDDEHKILWIRGRDK